MMTKDLKTPIARLVKMMTGPIEKRNPIMREEYTFSQNIARVFINRIVSYVFNEMADRDGKEHKRLEAMYRKARIWPDLEDLTQLIMRQAEYLIYDRGLKAARANKAILEYVLDIEDELIRALERFM